MSIVAPASRVEDVVDGYPVKFGLVVRILHHAVAISHNFLDSKSLCSFDLVRWSLVAFME